MDSEIEVKIEHDRPEIQQYHSTVHLAQMGALWYVVDSEGNKLSPGYHEIKVITDEKFVGKKGAVREEFEIGANGRA